MKAVFITKLGRPDVLQLRETPDVEPRAGEVRIAVKAAGINFADTMLRMGLYPTEEKPPFIPGFEAAGVIDRASGGWNAGDRVAVLAHGGCYATHVKVPASRVVAIPKSMCFEEAAGLPVVYLTAFHMMVRLGQLRRGEKILIHTAAGGVGLAAIQLARHIGAEIFGTSSPGKHEILRQCGVDHPIDYRSGDWAAEVRRIAPNGIDMVLDPLGGSATKRNYELLAPQGRLMVYGFSRAAGGRNVGTLMEVIRESKFNPRRMMMDNRAIFGVHIGRMNTPAEQAILTEELGELRKLYEAGVIRPMIGKTFPLAEAAEAHRYIARRENIGKVLLIP